MGLPFPGDAVNAFVSGFLSVAGAMRNYPVADRSLPPDELYPDQALG